MDWAGPAVLPPERSLLVVCSLSRSQPRGQALCARRRAAQSAHLKDCPRCGLGRPWARACPSLPPSAPAALPRVPAPSNELQHAQDPNVEGMLEEVRRLRPPRVFWMHAWSCELSLTCPMHPRGTGGHFGGEAVFSSGGAVGSGGGAIGTSGAISLAFLRRAGGGAIGTSAAISLTFRGRRTSWRAASGGPSVDPAL